MNILVIGAGVIGTIYSHQLARAGDSMTHLVRSGRLKQYKKTGIPLTLLDMRQQEPAETSEIYRPIFTDTLTSDNKFDLIIISVNSHQLKDILDLISKNIGKATVLFLQNMRPGEEDLISEYLNSSQYVIAYPFMAGGGSSDNGISGVIFGDKLSHTKLGERDGSMTPRIKAIKQMFDEAGMKPKITRNIITYIRTHYVWAAASLGAYMKAGSFDRFVNESVFIRESYIAMREALEICRRKGMSPLSVLPTALFYMPLFILVPFTQKSYKTEGMRRMWEGHISHSPGEMKIMYYDILFEGDEMGISMPTYRGFKPYIDLYLSKRIR